MKKVIRTHNPLGCTTGLEVGEVYDVLDETPELYLIRSVRGHNDWYLKENFKVIEGSRVAIYIGDDCDYLTKGKNYNVRHFNDDLYVLKCNDGKDRAILKERFLEPNTMPRPYDDSKVMTYVNVSCKYFTKGKNYNVDHFNDILYRVRDNDGRERLISKDRFADPSTVTREFDTKQVQYDDLHKWLKCNNLVLSEDRPVSTQQVGGTHYTDMNVQPFDFIEANKLTFFEGNVVKYLSRYKSKDGNRDIDKAIHYVKESFERLGDFHCRKITMTAEEYCKANNLPPVVELVLCWILEYPASISLELIVKLLEELKS